MTQARFRSLLAAVAVSAVLAHGLSGHGLAQISQDDMAAVGAGLCLILVVVLPGLAVRRADVRPTGVVAAFVGRPVAPEPSRPLDARERASPPALQRFRN